MLLWVKNGSKLEKLYYVNSFDMTLIGEPVSQGFLVNPYQLVLGMTRTC